MPRHDEPNALRPCVVRMAIARPARRRPTKTSTGLDDSVVRAHVDA